LEDRHAKQIRRRLVIVADMKIGRARRVDEFDQFFSGGSRLVEIVAIDFGNGLDYAALQADLVVVLGGDGAILRACRQMEMHQFPILGGTWAGWDFSRCLAQRFREHFAGDSNRELPRSSSTLMRVAC